MECMKRLMMSTKGRGQLMSNDTYFYDIWFSGVKTAEDMTAEEIYYCKPVKKIYKGFLLCTLEKLIKNYPRGYYIFMKNTCSPPRKEKHIKTPTGQYVAPPQK